jgi:glycosyltransferase involved in cell wall biosynthesis
LRRVLERADGRAPLLAWLGPLMTDSRESHDGAWVRELVASAASGPLAENVRFVGHVDHPELWLRAADAFVFASRQEGSPSVVRESLACGLPVVALELPGITDELILDGENGFLVPVADRARFQSWRDLAFDEAPALELFAERIGRVLGDPDRARSLREHARETAERRFSIEARARRVIQLLEPEARPSLVPQEARA